MSKPHTHQVISLDPGPLVRIFQLIAAATCLAQPEVKAGVQQKLAKEIEGDLLRGIHDRNGSVVWDGYMADVKAALENKIYQEDVEQAIKSLIKSTKEIAYALRDLQLKIKPHDIGEGKEVRKRMLEEIEDHTEGLKKLTKKMKDK